MDDFKDAILQPYVVYTPAYLFAFFDVRRISALVCCSQRQKPGCKKFDKLVVRVYTFNKADVLLWYQYRKFGLRNLCWFLVHFRSLYVKYLVRYQDK